MGADEIAGGFELSPDLGMYPSYLEGDGKYLEICQHVLHKGSTLRSASSVSCSVNAMQKLARSNDADCVLVVLRDLFESPYTSLGVD